MNDDILGQLRNTEAAAHAAFQAWISEIPLDDDPYDPEYFDGYGSFASAIDSALEDHPVKPSGYEWESHCEIYVPDPHDYRTYDEWDEAAWAHARLCVSDWYEGIRAIG